MLNTLRVALALTQGASGGVESPQETPRTASNLAHKAPLDPAPNLIDAGPQGLAFPAAIGGLHTAVVEELRAQKYRSLAPENLIAQLKSRDFETRELATRELGRRVDELDVKAWNAVKSELKTETHPESARRLKEICNHGAQVLFDIKDKGLGPPFKIALSADIVQKSDYLGRGTLEVNLPNDLAAYMARRGEDTTLTLEYKRDRHSSRPDLERNGNVHTVTHEKPFNLDRAGAPREISIRFPGTYPDQEGSKSKNVGKLTPYPTSQMKIEFPYNKISGPYDESGPAQPYDDELRTATLRVFSPELVETNKKGLVGPPPPYLTVKLSVRDR